MYGGDQRVVESIGELRSKVVASEISVGARVDSVSLVRSLPSRSACWASTRSNKVLTSRPLAKRSSLSMRSALNALLSSCLANSSCSALQGFRPYLYRVKIRDGAAYEG